MIQHIVITAGGTIEPIDSVRRIQNTSTGSLCASIYEALAARVGEMANEDVKYMVHYVVSETAVRPMPHEDLPVTFYPVTDVKSVGGVLEELLTRYSVSYVIHGMAVSDYTKNYLINGEELVSEMASVLARAIKEGEVDGSEDKLKDLLRGVLEHPGRQLDTSKKVSSKSDLMLSLKKAPKLIGKIKTLSPRSFLVGFKLLNDVAEEELISVACALAKKNACDMVLANDLKDIGHGIHKGLLLMDGTVAGRYHTKKEIAEGIVDHMFHGFCEAKGRRKA